jgi:valacyclovir hydrolase
MPWHGSEGARLYYEDTGRGDPVVLRPGWGGSIIELNGLRAALADGFRIVAIDLPGSGRSQPQPRHYTASYYADDAQTLLSLLDALGVGAAHLAGFSDGGEEALLLAGLRPSLALSVFTWGAAGQLVAPPGALDSLARAIDDPSPELIELAAYLTQAYGADSARVMTRSWAQAMGDLIAAGGDISMSRAHQISCPALLITGSHDVFCPPDLVSDLAGLIPRGEFREAHGAGHDVHQSHHGWLARQLGDWLAAH